MGKDGRLKAGGGVERIEADGRRSMGREFCELKS